MLTGATSTKRVKRGRDDEDSETPESEDEEEELKHETDASDSDSSYGSRQRRKPRLGSKRSNVSKPNKSTDPQTSETTLKPKPKPRPRAKPARIDPLEQVQDTHDSEAVAAPERLPTDTAQTVGSTPARRSGLRQRQAVNYRVPGPEDDDLEGGVGISGKPRKRPDVAKEDTKAASSSSKQRGVQQVVERGVSEAKTTLQADESDLTELSS